MFLLTGDIRQTLSVILQVTPPDEFYVGLKSTQIKYEYSKQLQEIYKILVVIPTSSIVLYLPEKCFNKSHV